jgi:malate dehydrogenase (oxaloacetate-decarboxylating)
LSIDRVDNGNDKRIKNAYKLEIIQKTNPHNLNGNLAQVIEGADAFIGVSGKGGILNGQMVQKMNHDAIVFALSNPDPEILPFDALQMGARIVATGRSDFANQINNAVVFPSVLRVLLDLRAKTLSEDMLMSVAYAIADIVSDVHLKEDYIGPKVNDPRILPTVTKALRDAIQKHVMYTDSMST